MQGIVLTLVMAVTVEALVEYGRTVIELIAGGGKKTALLQGAAVLVSVGLCLLTGADLFHTLGIGFYWQPIGGILTGIFAARGANFVSDLVGQLRGLLTDEI
ncbi:MAG: hypothetical protein IJN07_03370 [Clostridia bacterium]|nr:hypothetical protein [Clostridia bacterium]